MLHGSDVGDVGGLGSMWGGTEGPGTEVQNPRVWRLGAHLCASEMHSSDNYVWSKAGAPGAVCTCNHQGKGQ